MHNLGNVKSKEFCCLFLLKENFKFVVLKQCKLFFFLHFVLNHQCSGYSCLSLCRCVFPRVNSTILPLLISKPQFSSCFFPSDCGCDQETRLFSGFLSSVAQFLPGRGHCVYPAVTRANTVNAALVSCFASWRRCTGQQRGSEAVSLSSGISGYLSTLCLRVIRSLTIQVHTSESSNQNIIGNLA